MDLTDCLYILLKFAFARITKEAYIFEDSIDLETENIAFKYH